MKKLYCLLIVALLLCGCAAQTQPEQPNVTHSAFGSFDGSQGDMVYHVQDGMLVDGNVDATIPPETDATLPEVTTQPEQTSPLSGRWEYVDTLKALYILTLNDLGGAEIQMYAYDENGQPSLNYTMSDRPEIRDGRITFSGDTEYDPPSLVLQLEYVEGVGEILSVVSSQNSFADLTEYFYRTE